MIALTCTHTCTCHSAYIAVHHGEPTTIIIYSDPAPQQPCDEEKQESPDDSLFVIERFKGPPPPQKHKMQRTHIQPLIKRRNHCNIARPRLNLPRLKRQRAMRMNTSRSKP